MKAGDVVTAPATPALEYETVIGLEVHAQLITQSKMFCGCSAAAFTSEPNTNVCPVCMGMPGVLPVINRAAVRQAVRVALALHGEVQRDSKFDRKNYTYPDLPKGYQISQYDLPLSRGGYVIVMTDGGQKRIGITRVHMEEDTGRSLHRTRVDGTGYTLVDLNRAGVPLLEIVSEPDIRSAEEARDYLVTLRDLIRYIGASTGNMEEGALRCDANVSIRPHGATEFGAKVEIKNVNSFRGVYRALRYEVQRQASVLRAGGTLIQETRGWSEERGVTLPQRTKEYADDYRYFPEPDLPTLVLSDAFITEAVSSLPELPDARRERYIVTLGMPPADAVALTKEQAIADYLDSIVSAHDARDRVRTAVSLITNVLFRLIDQQRITVEGAPTASAVRDLLDMVDRGLVARTHAKMVYEYMAVDHQTAAEVVEHHGLTHTSDTTELEGIIDDAIATNGKAVADYRSGKAAALNALVGAVMKAQKGANNQVVREMLIQRLAGPV